jgi:hypothetical protein
VPVIGTAPAAACTSCVRLSVASVPAIETLPASLGERNAFGEICGVEKKVLG